MKILIIEDDPSITKLVAQALKTSWAEIDLVSTGYGEEGIELLKKELPDIVILDLMLPDIDGFEVLRHIRSFYDVLVVILTARVDVENRIRGLQEGADEYIIKPFSTGELVARMKALTRRREITKATARVAEKLSTRRISIDFEKQEVTVGDKLLSMGPSQYELFYILVTNKGVAISKQELLKKVFPEHGDDTRIVDVFIDKLRERLEEYANDPKIIVNDGTTGYKFVGTYSAVREVLRETEG